MSVPPELIPLVSAIIVGVANFVSILLAYYRGERRVEKKLDTYFRKVNQSEEYQLLIETIRGFKQLMDSSEATDLAKEATAAIKEMRTFLQKLRERSEVPEKEEGDTKPFLPPLRKPRVRIDDKTASAR